MARKQLCVLLNGWPPWAVSRTMDSPSVTTRLACRAVAVPALSLAAWDGVTPSPYVVVFRLKLQAIFHPEFLSGISDRYYMQSGTRSHLLPRQLLHRCAALL